MLDSAEKHGVPKILELDYSCVKREHVAGIVSSDVVEERVMAAVSLMTNANVRQLTHQQVVELLDRQAQKYLNLSGEEFVRRWDAGEFDDPERPEVMRIAMLLPFVR